MSADATLIYVHDPMCSWCWGFRPALERLVARLPPDVQQVRLLGGLASDDDRPMPDAMREYLQTTWHRIETRIPGTRFNFAFWQQCTPRRSTWPACRAVIAARRCDPAIEDTMIHAIQQAYFLDARNPSDAHTLVALANEIGLDRTAFQSVFTAPETAAELTEEMATARTLGVDGFPSLRLSIGGTVWPIGIDYLDHHAMLDAIATVRTA